MTRRAGDVQQQQRPSQLELHIVHAAYSELEMSVALGQSRGGGLGHGAPTILYSHANAEDLGNIYPWCKILSKMLGVNICAYDYTEYGLMTDQGV